MVIYGRLGKKVENVWNPISLTDCKWSNLNITGSESPILHLVLRASILPANAVSNVSFDRGIDARIADKWFSGLRNRRQNFVWEEIHMFGLNQILCYLGNAYIYRLHGYVCLFRCKVKRKRVNVII